MSGSGSQRELTRNKKVEAAISNEYLTRQRVAQLEKDVIHLRWCIDELEKRMAPAKGFFGKWLGASK